MAARRGGAKNNERIGATIQGLSNRPHPHRFTATFFTGPR
jgi:hypothetical protein